MNLEEFNKKNKKPNVPEGYFKSFPNEILKKVQKNETESPKVKRLYTYWSVAASIALIVSAVSLYYFYQNDQGVKNKLSSIVAMQIEQEDDPQMNEDLLAYYEYINLNIDEYEIEDIYIPSTIEEVELSNDEEMLNEEIELEQIIELL